MEIKEASEELKSKGYFYSVFAGGENTYNCETLNQAENEIAFHKGLRNKVAQGGYCMIYQWELVKDWTTNEIKNRIWANISCGQPIPGSVSVEALRMELQRRGEEPTGYHDT